MKILAVAIFVAMLLACTHLQSPAAQTALDVANPVCQAVLANSALLRERHKQRVLLGATPAAPYLTAVEEACRYLPVVQAAQAAAQRAGTDGTARIVVALERVGK